MEAVAVFPRFVARQVSLHVAFASERAEQRALAGTAASDEDVRSRQQLRKRLVVPVKECRRAVRFLDVGRIGGAERLVGPDILLELGGEIDVQLHTGRSLRMSQLRRGLSTPVMHAADRA